ncbi:dynein regulatory complex subunit 2 [Bacillus rossius redtenbacheri]|uniref:dynein regulatory complex subunit 2 n=1 Tax=Bacillus rossius redtenbacheri TaxID=93214 RepID=UPI002FDD4C95
MMSVHGCRIHVPRRCTPVVRSGRPRRMGPKKGKGKGSKLARMTDEERARYLQHRAAIEEEARRRKQQLIATFMKNQLKKEEGFARLNLAKINQQWWRILRGIKTHQLQQELKHIWQSFDHLVERKQQMVDSLLADLQEAEEQYSKGWRYHAEMIDRLLVLQGQRLWQLHEDYAAGKRALVEGAGRLARNVSADAAASEERLKAVAHLLTSRAEEEERTYRLDHQARLHDVTDTAATVLEQLQAAGQARAEALWGQLQQVLAGYAAATEPLQLPHARLRERDAQAARTVAQQRERAGELQRRVASLRARLAGRGDRRVAGLAGERDRLERLLRSLRARLEAAQGQDQQQLAFLTVASNRVIKKLEALVSKAEQILSVAALCRKRETEQEKVTPFGPLPFLPEDEDIAGVTTLQAGGLGGLWERYNRASLQQRALALHHRALCLENGQLRRELRRCLGATGDRPCLAPTTRPCTAAVAAPRRPRLVAVLPGAAPPPAAARLPQYPRTRGHINEVQTRALSVKM